MARREPFRDEDNRGFCGDFPLEEVHEDIFADPVNGIDRISDIVLGDVGQFFRSMSLAGRDESLSNHLVKVKQGFEQFRDAAPHTCVSLLHCL